jgi:hypothetical protein
LYCLSFYLQILITSLLSFGHCIVCPSSIYGFWLPLWYLLAIVLSVLFTDFDYLFGIFWPLYCLSFYLQILITSLVSFGHCIVCPIYGFWLPLWYLLAIVLSVLLFTDFDYLFGIFKLFLFALWFHIHLLVWHQYQFLLIYFCICALVPCVSNIFVRVCTSWRRGLSCSMCNLDKYIIAWVLIKLSNGSIFSSALAAMLVEFRLLLRVCFINLNWFFF